MRLTCGILIGLLISSATLGQSVYQESEGLVVMEMENTASPLDGTPGHVWIKINPGDANYVSGATGTGHLEFTGNTPSNGDPRSPLTYTFQINQAGNYHLLLRARKRLDGEESDKCNDAYVRMTGNFTSGSTSVPLSALTQDTKLYGGNAGGWGWATNLDGNGADHTACIYSFVAGETYTLTISGRSQRFNIDRIVLRHSSVADSYAKDTARPESSVAGGPPYTYVAITDFPTLDAGEVPYYVDSGRSALAIDAANTEYRGKFARAVVGFDGIPGTYTATITALQELDGECIYRLLVNGVVVGTATNSPTSTDYSEQHHVFRDIIVPAGATLAVESNTDSNGEVPEAGGFAWARGRWRTLTLATGTPGPTEPMILPGRIEAEDYRSGGEGVGYHDTTAGNSGNTYRTDDVDIQATEDTGGGYNIGWTAAGEWLAYELDVQQTGVYDVNLRVAALNTGGAFKLQRDGTDVTGTIEVPSTTAWQTYTDVLVPNIYFHERSGELRLVLLGGGFNVNYLDVQVSTGLPQVNAGEDQYVLLPTNSIALVGSATDNSAIASTVWTRESGPAGVTLTGADTTTLTVSNLLEGTYLFRLTATDDEANSVSDDVTVYVLPEGSGQATVTGEFKKWHKFTFSWTGPASSETATPNPFADYRLDVTFTHPGTGKSYLVPGYYAADGNAADSSAEAGNIWMAHFAPDEEGLWSYSASFRTATDVAVAASTGSGSSAGFFDGDTGTFTVLPTDKTGRDFRGKGRLRYVNKHHLQFAETGEYFLKAGADAPENFLSYDDFDDTPNTGGRRKSWSAHAGDYNATEASAYTWQRGQGTAMLGAVKYLSTEGLNAFSFLTFNVDGDDDNAFPHRLRSTVSAYEGVSDNQRWGNTSSGPYHDRFDVSKMAQWERIFEYGDQLGMYLHFKTMETENELKMDGGDAGRERKLYYRELIARFGHHLALNWNLGEEINDASTAQKQAWAQYVHDTDPYHHHIVIHNGDNHYELMGSASKLTGFSLQTSNSDFASVHSRTLDYLTRSADAGKPWVVACDEPGDASHALRPAGDTGDSWVDGRKNALWGNLMAGGAGLEFYFGYQHDHSDLTCQDWRSRDGFWDYCRYALEFFEANSIPFWEMENDNGLSTASDDYCFYKAGHTYLVYLKNGGTTSLNLSGAGGTYIVRWYDPRNGGPLQVGSEAGVTGGGTVSLGGAPDSTGSDWLVFVTQGLPGQNFPPVVDAGPDQAQVLLPGNELSIILDGIATDDGLPTNGVLRTRWSQVSGPSDVVFGDTWNPRTVATFDTQGTYVLNLLASDFELVASNNVTITLGSSVGGQEASIGPSDDAYLQGSGDTLFNNADLRVEVGNRVSYLKFTVTGANGLAGATLELTEGSDPGNGTINVHAGSHNNWTETTLSGATKPAKQGGALATFSGTVSDGQALSFDVGSYVTGNGTYSFVVEHTSGNDVSFASKESTTAAAPELVMDLPNTAPACEISSPTNGTVLAENAPFSVTAGATDADGPVASMELFVDGVSAGAFSGSSATWPIGGLTAGAHRLVVVATDAADTVGSSEATVSVVARDFAVGAMRLQEGIGLTWGAVPGLRYRVWHTDSLMETNWTALGEAQEASSDTMSFTNGPTAAPQGFYRLEELLAP